MPISSNSLTNLATCSTPHLHSAPRSLHRTRGHQDSRSSGCQPSPERTQASDRQPLPSGHDAKRASRASHRLSSRIMTATIPSSVWGSVLSCEEPPAPTWALQARSSQGQYTGKRVRQPNRDNVLRCMGLGPTNLHVSFRHRCAILTSQSSWAMSRYPGTSST